MLSRKEVRWIMAKKKRAIKEITFEVSLIPLKLYIKVVFKQALGRKPYPTKPLYHKNMKIGNTKINFKFKVGWKEASKKEKIVTILGYLIIAGIIIFLLSRR